MRGEGYNARRMGDAWVCTHGHDKASCRDCAAEKRKQDTALTEALGLPTEKKPSGSKKPGIDAAPIMLEKIIGTVNSTKLEGFVMEVLDAKVGVSGALLSLRNAMNKEDRSSVIRLKGEAERPKKGSTTAVQNPALRQFYEQQLKKRGVSPRSPRTPAAEGSHVEKFREALMGLDAEDRYEIAQMLKRLAS